MSLEGNGLIPGVLLSHTKGGYMGKKTALILRQLTEIEERIRAYKDLLQQDPSCEELLKVLQSLKEVRERLGRIEGLVKEVCPENES